MKKNILVLVLCLLSCANPIKQKKETKTLKNYFPEIFEAKLLGNVPTYQFKVISKDFEFECRERNDYPHYWCSFQFELLRPHGKYLDKAFVLFMSSRSKEIIEFFRINLKKFQNKLNGEVTLQVVYEGDGIFTESRDKFLFSYVGIYNKKYCMNWFNNFSSCPEGSKKLAY